MKYITNNYGYKNEWFSVLLSLVFTPFYGCLFIRNFSWDRAKAYFAPERRAVLKYPVLTGVLYTVETVFVFYALNTVTLSYYTILRSGFIIFNIPWFKYLLKKPVTRLYYASCAALVVSHAIATGQYIVQYNGGGGGGGGRSGSEGGNVVQNTVIIFVSCFLNSAYNNMIEYAMKLHGDTMSNIDFQVLFQATYFALAAPWAVFYTVKHTPPVTAESITMYFFIAFGLQLYMFNKIYILNTPQTIIPANILLSGLDLVRRVIQLTYSFVCFKEPFDAMIGLSLVFLGTSAGLLLYQYIRDYRRNFHHANTNSDERHRMLELSEIDSSSSSSSSSSSISGYEGGDEKV
jgi:drug/metabolite transporter (DMT)-like permease